MGIYDLFKTDAAVEKDGIELDYGKGGVIRICRAGGANSRFGKLLGDRLKPYRRQLDNGTMDDDVANRIMAEVYADSIIIGWRSIADPDGNDLEFTRENCVRLLIDLPELFRDIQEQAAKVANFRKLDLEADAKN